MGNKQYKQKSKHDTIIERERETAQGMGITEKEDYTSEQNQMKKIQEQSRNKKQNET